MSDSSKEAHRIILTGASGLVGSKLSVHLSDLGFQVVPYKSRSQGPHAMCAVTGTIDKEGLEGALAVIHLAGESIAQSWTQDVKSRIMSSRKDNTLLLSRTLAGLTHKPQVFISMSGINRYGTHRSDVLTEDSTCVVDGFLSEVSEAWEAATAAVQAAGIRTVLLRTSLVLSAEGGGLSKMLPAFKCAVGGPIGGGEQQVSWIGMPDLLELIVFAMNTPSIKGPLNATSPNPVPQAEFAQALGKAVHRPAFIPLPAFAISLLFGKMGEETVLSDLAVFPALALSSGFVFRTPDLVSALEQALQ